jgi:hypothetical protein
MSHQQIITSCGDQFGTGWVDDQAAVWATVRAIEAQGVPALFEDAAPHLIAAADDDAPVFFWEAEKRLLGKVLPSWNQRSVGSCVGFGNGRAGQDILLWEVAAGEPEQWPGAEICPEIIYGGSRVEVGGGRISGDGSIGAWAAKWVKDWGLVPRGVYGSLDVTTYNESTCRQLGRNGIPAEVETAARLHPVTAVAMVRSGDDWWAGTGAGKPSAICSGRGFTTTLKKGFCQPSGSWAHCMEGRGRFRRAGDKEKCGVIQNSWGGYLSIPSQDDKFIDVWTPTGDIRVELPEGCFATTLDVIDRMLGEQDSFFFAGLKGWEAVKLDYTP